MPRVLVNLLQSTGTKGGIEIYARELYTELGHHDSEFEFIGFASTELAGQDHSWFPGTVIDSGINGENRFTWAWGELFAVSRAATKLGVDLIHGPAMFGPLETSIPVVISVHDLLYFSHPHLMKTSLFTEPVKWMERRGARNASRLITISQYSARAIETYLQFPADRVDVIPLAGRSVGAVTRSHEPRLDSMFLAVGQRSPYKDLPTVVRAWAEIPLENRPQLVVTGSHGEDPLIPIVRELELEQWVSLRDWVSKEELDRLFETATALIDSTLASGFSMPTIEAMGIGLPVLLADTEVFREVGGDAARFFRAGDPADLARAVQELTGSRGLRLEMGAAGRERARQYSWNRVAEGTLTSFRAALAEPRRGRH